MDQSRLKHRISRMFRASFGSCRARNPSDVDDKVVFATHPPRRSHRRITHFETIPPLMTSPKPRPFPSICNPRCSESNRPAITHSFIRVSGDPLRRRPRVRLSDRHSPVSPLDFYAVSGKKNTKTSKRKHFSGEKSGIKREPLPFGSSSGWWLSSDDDEDDGENETDTLFSSKPISSDSSESRRRRKNHRRSKRAPQPRNCEVGTKISAGKVKNSFAVVKRSSDPYSDFRTSMVEMIVEKQIFGGDDLENLLQCFLSLNSRDHHEIIVHVFTEIWEALFCNWS